MIWFCCKVVRARQQQAEAQGKSARQQAQGRPSQLAHIPRRRNDVDIGDVEVEVGAGRRETLLGKFLGFLDVVEAFFFKDQLRHAVLD